MLYAPSPRGFEERYVLLDCASFFEVSAPLRAAQGAGGGGGGVADEEVASQLREIFQGRAEILRVIYAASAGARSVAAMAGQVGEEERNRLATLSEPNAQLTAT